MKTLIPAGGLQSLRKEMDRLIDRFWDEDSPELPALGEWKPLMDVSETKETVTVRLDVPGLEPRDIQVSVQSDLLLVKGEKRMESEQNDERFYRSERSFGSFTRGLRLPAPVEPGQVTATFKNGVLTITMPKTAAARESLIPIKTL